MLDEENKIVENKLPYSDIRYQILNMVAHFVCILYSAYIAYTAQPGTSLFSWHPFLMTMSFMFLIAQGILVFSPHSSLLQAKARKLKTTVHWILMVLSTVCALLGFSAIYYNKVNANKEHFVSWHGRLGLATVGYLVLQCVAGLNVLYPQTAARLVRLVTLKRLHAVSGVLMYTLATGALLTGMFSNWFVSTVTGTSWYACAACPLLLLTIFATQVKNAYIG